jgi:stearoyl-CoA 9-desaturase NADPH oxidoreductase
MTMQIDRRVSPLRQAGRELARVTGEVADLFAAPHGADRYRELVRPTWVRGEVRARVVAARRQTSDTVTLTVRTNRAWDGFRAGQYVHLTVEVDGVLRSRCYSPAGSEHGPRRELEFTVKQHPGGLVSTLLTSTRDVRGLMLRLSPAEGVFTLPAERPDRLLLLSGGSGITPVMSMLRTLACEDHQGQVTFVHYADDAADVPYRAELLGLAQLYPNLQVVLAYTRPGARGDLPGLFSGEKLARVVPWYLKAQTYLCGPPGLTDAVCDHYRTIEQLDRLHIERFTARNGPILGSARGGTVSFSRSGIQVPSDGSTLLDLAERAGLDARRGCGMGICFRCVQVKRSGRVRNLVTGRDHDDPDEEVQVCVGVPVGDVDLDL